MIKIKPFWDLKLNPITMLGNDSMGFTKRNNDAKKRSKQRTIEKRELKLAQQKNERI